jgi:hypothetical protein
VRLQRPLDFLIVPTCWEICFSSRRYSTYFFSSSSFLDHHTGHPAHHDAQILLMSASLMPSEVLLTVYFGAPSMFITLWFGFDYGTNPPLGTLII